MRSSGQGGRSVAQRVASVLYSVLHAGTRGRRVFKRIALVGQFGSHGVNFVFDPDGVYSFKSIHVGNNVDLGYRPILIATRSTVRIGSNVMFGPEVTIRGGNHRFDLQGIPMIDVTDAMKLPDHDRGVVIEDDVWIGTRAIILHGVTIGRGSVVGAGSVVTKSVPEFVIVAGVPARVLRNRFAPEQLTKHLASLANTPHNPTRGADRL
jgi:acetyltransferase-like isoleucine patch superfamily enzyme